MTKERKFAYLMAGLCGVSVASAIGSYIQHKRTASLLKKTVKELAEASPIEIENLAGEFPAIRECACIGVPDPKQTLGQIPVLFLVKEEGFSLEELKKYLNKRMERFKIPQEFVEVEALPRNRMKKLDRKAMRSIWEQRSPEGSGSAM